MKVMIDTKFLGSCLLWLLVFCCCSGSALASSLASQFTNTTAKTYLKSRFVDQTLLLKRPAEESLLRARPRLPSLPATSDRNIDSPKGVGFERWIAPSNLLALADIVVTPAEACEEYDKYGANKCHFTWGTLIKVDYTVRFGQPIQAEDYVEGKLTLDEYLPYHFRCALCGTDCKLEIPVVHATVTVPMAPECPIPSANHTKHMDYKLWDHSPSDGIVLTKLEGQIDIVEGKTGNVMVSLQIEVDIK